MHRVGALDGLQLEDQASLDQQVHFQCIRDALAPILDANGPVTDDTKARQPQLDDHAFAVDGFEEPRPERAMNRDRAADHLLNERVECVSENFHVA